MIADLLCILPWRGRAPDALAVLDQAFAGRRRPRNFRKAVADGWSSGRTSAAPSGLAACSISGPRRAESPPESWLRLVLIENGFPLPEVNWVIATPDGRELVRLDLAWPRLRICMEYDGWETMPVGRPQDDARAAELRRHGWIVIRVDVDGLRDVRQLVTELRAAFAKRGYTW